MSSPIFRQAMLPALLTWLVLAALSPSVSAALKASLITTRLPSADYVIASAVATEPDFGAVPDGRTDATAAIQNAIDSVSRIGGGVVFLPAGRYLCAGSLRLKCGVSLRGEWEAPGDNPSVRGTILLPTGGRGSAEGAPFITIECGACVRNLSIWYPDQLPANIMPYPWTIANDDNRGIDCFTVENVTLVNPYQAMSFKKGSELHVVRNVYGTPLKTGFFVDNCGDNGRLVNVHFGPQYWIGSGLMPQDEGAAVAASLAASATAIVLTRTDCEDMYDVSADGYLVGIQATRSASGFPYAEGYQIRMSGCVVGLQVDQLNMGLQFTHCVFSGSTAGVLVGKNFGSALQFTDCDIRGGEAVQSNGGGTLQFQDCILGASIDMAQGGSINIIGCSLKGVDSRVLLAPGIQRALIRGSLSRRQVVNHSLGDVQVTESDGAVPLAGGPLVPALPPDPRPSKPILFDVTDYSAVADASADAGTDNTQAFQNALNAAGYCGGGTVYVPAGCYRFIGNLFVPMGVELRGSFDGPHHTVAGGTMLFPAGGRGQESGTPFISLSSGSGVRGLSVWYPDQRVDDIAAYPWTVRALGPDCWLVDFTASNAYQMADFGSNSSNGSLLRSVLGCALRRGIWMSKGSAVVDGCHFNPHFWLRAYPGGVLLRGVQTEKTGDLLSDYVSSHLDVFTFGDCPHLLAVNDGLCSCSQGFRFVEDGGRGTGGLVINPASDCTIAGAFEVDQVTSSGLRVYNPELITLRGDIGASQLRVTPSCTGPLYFASGMSWGLKSQMNKGPELALLGKGATIINGWKALGSNPIQVGTGSVFLRNVDCETDDTPAVQVVSAPVRMSLIGDSAGLDALTYTSVANEEAVGNAREIPPLALTDAFASDFSATAPHLKIQSLVVRDVEDASCLLASSGARNGGPALILTGQPVKGDASSAAYYSIYDVNLPVTAETYLRYWFEPETTAGENIGVDLNFTDGSSIRDLGVMDSLGRNLHPGQSKGTPGKWTMVQALIGSAAAGKTITRIVFAYEGRPDGSAVNAVLDKIEIGQALAAL